MATLLFGEVGNGILQNIELFGLSTFGKYITVCYNNISVCFLAWGFNWLGLNDLTVEGILEWSDGSTVSYTRFAPNMPDTHEDDEHCFIMLKTNGDFVNKPCWYPQTFICETNHSLMFT
jgi:hypothetical protein